MTTIDTPSNPADVEAEEEARWLAYLQRLPWYKRPSVVWMMPMLLILSTALGALGSPRQQLAIRIVCKDFYANLPSLAAELMESALEDDKCQQPAVLAAAALLHSRVGAVQGILIGTWTSLSDKYGRKVLMLNTMITLIMSSMLSWLMASEHNPFGPRVLYLDAVMFGLTSGNVVISPAAFSYVADCTSAANRSVTIGYIITSFAVGLTIGPFLGGYLATTIGIVPLIKLVILAYFAIVAYMQFIPESLKKGSKKSPVVATEEMAGDSLMSKVEPSLASLLMRRLKSGLKTVVAPLMIFVPGAVPVSGNVPSKYTLTLVLLATQLSVFAESGTSLYRCRRIGSSLSSSSSSTPSSEEALTQKVLPDQGKTESMIMDITFFNYGVTLAFLSIVVVLVFLTPASLFVSEAISNLGNFSGPSMSSVLTSLVPADQVGGALGAMCVADAITTTSAYLLFGHIYAVTSATRPWMFYYVGAAVNLLAVCAGLSLRALYGRRRIAL
ncbi:hypothetical protein BG006_006750 [Podila minutissima]|uniref:Major facilitator superfamily (MFS) profile domain-containing protein n=1 Tax=Podila minutissima TaxID=64525 RepID=A0A9P5SKT2_9FUNG|nr:hypothetical protein BG006_006750 [Podila minutissima]